jgi:hypothetical protein
LDKNCFFAYILRLEFYAILKQWLQEAYWCKAGMMMKSTISEPETFEGALLCLFREWRFEQKMMDLIARREKDVIKNDFARLVKKGRVPNLYQLIPVILPDWDFLKAENQNPFVES